MSHHLLPLLIVTLGAVANTSTVADDRSAKDVPELEALSHYVGAWDMAITSSGSPFEKGRSTAKWILDGRFVQQTGVVTAADGSVTLKVTTLMTYDQDAQTYRMWSFLSNGSTSEATGAWDAPTQTMTSTSRDGTKTTKTTAIFTDDGVESWMIVTVNQNNEVIGKISGTNTRRED